MSRRSAAARSGEDEITKRVALEVVPEHIVEFLSDWGEGAQAAGQLLGSMAAAMGNGVWTAEIIPAETDGPARSRAGASGNRVRIGGATVTNPGDSADLVVAFNEQVVYGRIDADALVPGTTLLLESKWAQDPSEGVAEDYQAALADFRKRGFHVIEVPMEQQCGPQAADLHRGKSLWALGMVAWIYHIDLERACAELRRQLAPLGEASVAQGAGLLRAGHAWAGDNLTLRFEVPPGSPDKARVVMNGNQAIALGAMAAGIEVCALYPITPASSICHYLSDALGRVGGFVHEAEDAISAIGFALGAAYAGKTPITVTSGPGLCLKAELIGLAVMGELPLVIVDVQRGGPSTGKPTGVEQGDLLAGLFGQPGDAPKIIVAPSTIEECFHLIVTARKLAETFRGPVLVLTDASLATGRAPFCRPEPKAQWLTPPVDQAEWEREVPPFAWDPQTGLSQRPIPGQSGGEYVLTALSHDESGRVACDARSNQRAMAARSRKLATLYKTLKPPRVHGDESGDLLVVGWGSTRGAIEETVDRLRADGKSVSSLHLTFLSPLEPGLEQIFDRFKRVLTIEANYSDEADDEHVPVEARRYAQLAWLLRARTLRAVDCWSCVGGVALPPAVIEAELRRRLSRL